jgi:heme/copper-type cytochrome/quinol oxidase subunit 2
MVYDSYMSKESNLDFRKLEVDCPLVVKSLVLNRILLGSRDVIHRFAIPQLGFKLDCVPGRLNQRYLKRLHLGKYYGQCSEICGANHSFMPIRLECISNKKSIR